MNTIRRSVSIALFALFFTLVGAVAYAAAQPHMTAARGYLQSALTELNAANTNKGGHRANAVKLVTEAISEVDAGISYAASQ